MIKKFDVITKLYEEATQEVTESPEKWIAFLQSASKNYRLPFDEQLLIMCSVRKQPQYFRWKNGMRNLGGG